MDVSISTINALSNLIALCKNCHWEQHNNLIDLKKLFRNAQRESNPHVSS